MNDAMHTASRVHSQIKYAMYTASRVPKRLYFVYTHGWPCALHT